MCSINLLVSYSIFRETNILHYTHTRLVSVKQTGHHLDEKITFIIVFSCYSCLQVCHIDQKLTMTGPVSTSLLNTLSILY